MKIFRAIFQDGTPYARRTLIPFLIGLLLGFFIVSYIAHLTKHEVNKQESVEKNITYWQNLLTSLAEQYDQLIPQNHKQEDRTIADKLYKETRVLCWIMTKPENHFRKAIHIKRTWGKRCNKLLIISSKDDKELGAIGVDVHEGHRYLWSKVKEAFKYIYKNHFVDYDWFLKADDDTYTIMENLRYMLYPYSPDTPIYFGCRFNAHVKQGYMSGGAGYVLSKEALRRFIEEALPNEDLCSPNEAGASDVEIGKCLEAVNVTAGDTRDDKARGRFFAFTPEDHLTGQVDMSNWYWHALYYPTDEGLDCCSDYAISFHYVSPKQLYVLDYLIYHLKPFGIIRRNMKLPEKLEKDATLTSPIEPVDVNTDRFEMFDKFINSSEASSSEEYEIIYVAVQNEDS